LIAWGKKNHLARIKSQGLTIRVRAQRKVDTICARGEANRGQQIQKKRRYPWSAKGRASSTGSVPRADLGILSVCSALLGYNNNLSKERSAKRANVGLSVVVIDGCCWWNQNDGILEEAAGEAKPGRRAGGRWPPEPGEDGSQKFGA